MKILQKKTWLFTIIIPLLFIVPFVAYAMLKQHIIDLAYIHWFALGIICLIILTPLGNRRALRAQPAPRNTPTHYPLLSWLMIIILLEFSFLFIFWGLAHFMSVDFPIFSTPHPHASLHIMRKMLLQYGLFPCAFIGLLSASISYLSYTKNRDSYMGDLMLPVLHSSPNSGLGMITNTTLRAITSYALCFTTSFISLILVLHLTDIRLLISLAGFKASAFIAAAVILVFFSLKWVKRRIKRLIENLSPALAILFLTFVFAVLLGLLSILFLSKSNIAIKVPHIMQVLMHTDWATYWYLLALCWWLAWSPLISLLISRISYGRSLRSILLGTLLLPTGLILMGLASAHFHWQWTFLNHFSFTVILPLISFTLLILGMCRQKLIPIIMLCYLPKSEQVKYRPATKFIQQWFLFAALMLYFYLPAGVYVLALFALLAFLPILIYLLLSSIGFILQLKRH